MCYIFRATRETPAQSHMVDLLDVNLGEPTPADPWTIPQPPKSQVKYSFVRNIYFCTFCVLNVHSKTVRGTNQVRHRLRHIKMLQAVIHGDRWLPLRNTSMLGILHYLQIQPKRLNRVIRGRQQAIAPPPILTNLT